MGLACCKSAQCIDNGNGGLPKDMQNMIQFLVNVSIGPAAARIINMNQTEIVWGGFEQLDVSTKFKHWSIHCDVSLKFYGLNAPEGSFAQSVSSTQKENALVASLVYSPVGENVDWRLSATISPCHATVLLESYDRFLEFVQRSKAVAPPTRKCSDRIEGSNIGISQCIPAKVFL